jgi:hypothetical protein
MAGPRNSALPNAPQNPRIVVFCYLTPRSRWFKMVDMPIQVRGNISVVKSTGYMITLMSGMNLPLVRFTRGQRVVYTTVPFGPIDPSVYDWTRSSPVRFTERHVEKALAAGFVVREDNNICLSGVGRLLAQPCSEVWGPLLDDYFHQVGYTCDWRKLRE